MTEEALTMTSFTVCDACRYLVGQA